MNLHHSTHACNTVARAYHSFLQTGTDHPVQSQVAGETMEQATTDQKTLRVVLAVFEHLFHKEN